MNISTSVSTNVSTTQHITMEQQAELEFELATTARKGILTEERYNQIMDALLPPLEGFPEVQATLVTFGKEEWRIRRENPSKAPSSAA
jgi:hypothetical protein